MRLHELADGEAVAREAAVRIAAADAASGDRFAICLSGGSTPQTLYRMLASDEFSGRLRWQHWHVFFGDERQVPLDDERSNFANARHGLLDHVPVPDAQIHPLADADQYEGLLRAFFGDRCDFDVLLLGMGDDGHTASLFPGSVSLMEEERWVIEPPDVVAGMARLTLTLPALRAARSTLILVSGVGKHDALSRVREGEPLPSGMLPDADWLVDRPALTGG